MSEVSTPRSSRSRSRSTSTPCIDNGSFWKLIFNWSTPLRHNKRKVKEHDDSEVVVVGAGRHIGVGTQTFVNSAVEKLLYFSYRNCFTPLPNGYTTDTRWGCLIRTGQMLMAYAVTRFYYSKLVELSAETEEQEHQKHELETESSLLKALTSSEQESHSVKIEQCTKSKSRCVSKVKDAPHHKEELWEMAKVRSQELFMDLPSAPFGIHRLENEAFKRGVQYGTWLSPTPIAYALAAAGARFREELNKNFSTSNKSNSDSYNNNNEMSHSLPIIMCCEGRIINKTEIQNYLQHHEHVILLVPVYLGIGKLNMKYKQALYRFLNMHSACGAAGGRDRASLFIIGYQGERVLVFDPHIIQCAYTSAETAGKTIGRYYMISIDSVDPCMLLGFYLDSNTSFQIFEEEIAELNAPLLFPLISITEAQEEQTQEEVNSYCNTSSNKKIPQINSSTDEKRESQLNVHNMHDDECTAEITWSDTQDESVFSDNVHNVDRIDDINETCIEEVNTEVENASIGHSSRGKDGLFVDLDAVTPFTGEASTNPFKPK